MRASVAYRIANGDAASSNTGAHAIVCGAGCLQPGGDPALVEAATGVPGRDQRERRRRPRRATRAASLPVPKTAIQMCSSA